MKILVTPHQFLRIKAKPVLALDKKLKEQIADMIQTLKTATNPEGVGLAATQVGLDKRLFIVSLAGKPEVFINPQIISTSEAMLSDVHPKNKDRWMEGCLSIPGFWGFVDRPYSVELEYQTLQKDELITKRRKFEDVESSYVQHENDHLNGVLFTDHILKQGGILYQESKEGLVPVKLS